MSLGSILIGLAIALIVGAWLIRPFRHTAHPDRAIEYWVTKARLSYREPSAPVSEGSEEEIRFCPRCGRRVGPEDRFCARCGTPLRANFGN
ncbi:MAG: zinc-ribbon domain-containing protein [Anaerolineae bacterium]|nr:zinc-ribbon domain-containing protein [Anaerolineae bacterium]MCX8068587.1 zinc-ribbon domain-containing protein [Anaerolineae bacterium]MDW7992413.1 zinc-ribbon domain-containing protein [Anaerolineae bacterium]